MLLENGFYAIAAQASLRSENIASLIDAARKKPQYHCVKVEQRQFSAQYNTQGWVGRKAIALPMAVWCALVQTTFHLARLIFLGLSKSIRDGGKALKLEAFLIGRDFQEAGGWLTSLFNDQLGLYHIQASRFHRAVYNYATTDKTSETLLKQEVSRFFAQRKTPFFKIKQELKGVFYLNEAEFSLVSPFFGLEHFRQVFGRQVNWLNYASLSTEAFHAVFMAGYGRVDSLTGEKLRKVSLQLKKIYPLLQEDRFWHLSLQCVNNIDYKELTKEKFDYLYPLHKALEQRSTWEKLGQLTDANLHDAQQHFSAGHFHSSLIRRLNYDTLSQEQFERVFPNNNCQTAAERFNFLEKTTLQKSAPLFLGEAYSAIPPNSLNYSQLSKQQFQRLFPVSSLYQESTKRNLAQLSPENFAKAIPLLSAEHFSLLLKWQVEAIIAQAEGLSHYFPLLFPEGIQDREATKARFSALSRAYFIKIVPHLTLGHFFAIPDTKLNYLNLDALTKEQFSALFPAGDEKNKKRLGALFWVNFQKIQHYLPGYYAQLPDVYLSSVNFAIPPEMDVLDLSKRFTAFLQSPESQSPSTFTVQQICQFFDLLAAKSS